jgi:hypothetical protein
MVPIRPYATIGPSMYFGTDYTATRSGVVVKFVQCVECDCGYAYEMERTIQASAFSPLGLSGKASARAATEDAVRRLDRALRESCDPVPCPRCGWYQSNMVKRVRQIRLRWVKSTAFALFPLSILSALFALDFAAKQYWPLVGLGTLASLIGLACLLLIARYLLNRRYDPNTQPESKRIAIGESLSLSRAEYRRLMLDRE